MSMISRTNAESLIPEETAREILSIVPSTSAALKLFRNVNMSSKIQRMPVQAAIPTASFVNGDTGLKPVTNYSWENKYIEAEPIAAIVAIPEDVLDDADFDLEGDVKVQLAGAIADALDKAVFFGTGKPSSWPAGIIPDAITAGNVVARGGYTAAEGGISEDINELLAKVEADGFDPNGFVATRAIRRYLRGARDANGQRLLEINGDVNRIEGLAVEYALAGSWPTGDEVAEMVTGDFNLGIIATRSDITFKVLTEATLHNPDGTLMFNLPQQDMVAVRVVARYGFQVANMVTRENSNASTRYPFAVLTSPEGA